MSTCCPQRLLWKEMKIRAVTVNNNKLLSVNKKKTPLGSKFTRICMGTFLSRNCGQTKHQALKLGEWHPDMTGNMMKARLRMSDQVRHLRGRDTTVTVAKRNRCLAIIPCSAEFFGTMKEVQVAAVPQQRDLQHDIPYYAYAMRKVPVTWNCFMQGCGKSTTIMNMTLPPSLCNFKSIDWNPGVQALIQVYLRGLSTKVTVANTRELHQIAQNGCLWCGYYSNIKYNIWEV